MWYFLFYYDYLKKFLNKILLCQFLSVMLIGQTNMVGVVIIILHFGFDGMCAIV